VQDLLHELVRVVDPATGARHVLAQLVVEAAQRAQVGLRGGDQGEPSGDGDDVPTGVAHRDLVLVLAASLLEPAAPPAGELRRVRLAGQRRKRVGQFLSDGVQQGVENLVQPGVDRHKVASIRSPNDVGLARDLILHEGVPHPGRDDPDDDQFGALHGIDGTGPQASDRRRSVRACIRRRRSPAQYDAAGR
jgi:hypothetical protein